MSIHDKHNVQSSAAGERGARECRHILPSGAKCHALALRGNVYCYFHSRLKGLAGENRDLQKTFMIPLIEDRASIQMAINEVLYALGANKIDPRRAAQYLYGLQLSIQNLSRLPDLAAPNSVSNPEYPENGELLAPEPPPDQDPPAEQLALPLTGLPAQPQPDPFDIRSLTPREWDLDAPTPESDKINREIAALTKSTISHYLAILRLERNQARRNQPPRNSDCANSQADPSTLLPAP